MSTAPGVKDMPEHDGQRKAYVSGPVSLGGLLSGDETRDNVQRFIEAGERLATLGYEPLLPTDNTGESWRDFMRAGLRQLLAADIVVMLPGWEKSVGARVERALALELEMPVWTLGELLRNHARGGAPVPEPVKPTREGLWLMRDGKVIQWDDEYGWHVAGLSGVPIERVEENALVPLVEKP